MLSVPPYVITSKQKNYFLIALSSASLAIGLARVGSDEQQILACSLSEMSETNLGPPLHCLVIPGNALHPLESEYLLQYAMDKTALQ